MVTRRIWKDIADSLEAIVVKPVIVQKVVIEVITKLEQQGSGLPVVTSRNLRQTN